MKCPNCDGKGMVDYPMYADDEHKWQYCVARMKKCDMCNGTGEVPMTNEEFMRSTTTEQLAEAIYYLTWFHTELDERLDKNVKNGRYNDDENIKIVMEWLKQPHRLRTKKRKNLHLTRTVINVSLDA